MDLMIRRQGLTNPRIDTIGLLLQNQLIEFSDPITTRVPWTHAFQSKTTLKKIKLPNATGTIGSYSFDGCSGLEDVNIPKATGIGEYTFENCTSLTQLSLPLVTSVGQYAFAGCSKLSSIDFMDNLTTINSYTFSRCIGFKNYDFFFPRVTSIGSYIFNGNNGGGSGPTGCAVFPQLSSIPSNGFRYSSVHNIDIGAGVASLPTNCFYQAGTFSIIILRHISSIVSCSASSSISSIGSTTKVYVHSNLIDEYKAASSWSAKGNIFYPIEGSEYEHYYVDGRPRSDISYIISNAVISSSPVWIPYGQSYSSILKCDIGYAYKTPVSIIMGGIDITEDVYNENTGEIFISSVTDYVEIRAVAEAIEYVWDYEWDYTDGLLEDNGWTKTFYNTGATSTLTENGLELTSLNSTNVAFTNPDYSSMDGIFEIVLSGTYNTTTAYWNSWFKINNETSSIFFHTPKSQAAIRYQGSGASNSTIVGSVPNGSEFTVRLALQGTRGCVSIDGNVLWRDDNTPKMKNTNNLGLASESQQSGYSTIIKSIRIKQLNNNSEVVEG